MTLFNMKLANVAGGALMALLIAITLGQGAASAQVIAPTQSSCIILNSNVGYGANDYSYGGAVSSLQTFLVGQGYFNSAYLGTGHYGSITLRAVAQFQAAHGVPATGFVGPLTRALIQQLTCGINPVPPTQQPVSIYSESPTAGPVGTTVTLTGYGFSNSNTVLMNGSVAATNVPITSSIAIACTTNPNCHGGIQQTITFKVPSALAPYCAQGFACAQYMMEVMPGQYTVTVLNAYGTSNAVTFTVTSGGTVTQPLSINGISAPSSLTVGQTGTWSVQVAASAGINLHYSVVWGDENLYYNGYPASTASSVQSSATFTHAYAQAGTYTPVFTVTDDYGHSVSASNTTVVSTGTVPNGGVTLYSASPNPAAIGTLVTLTGYGLTSNNTILFGTNVAASNVAAYTNSSGLQTLTFTVPSSVGPNCPSSSLCPAYRVAVMPGQYALSVQNSNGTSNTITFTVSSTNSTVQPY